MRVTLIHNPGAGGNEHDREQLVHLLKHSGHEVDYYSSKDEWHAALDGPSDVVAVAGGDGTVGEVATAVAGRLLPIAVLPMGTANNIAGALGLNAVPIADLVAGWRDATPRPFDLGVARGPWGTCRFLESVGAGLLSETMSEILGGASAYVNQLDDPDLRISAALDVCDRVLDTVHPVSCQVSVDGHEHSGEFVLVEVLNFGMAGPNLRLAPYADAFDGLLDVVLVEAGNRQLLANQVSLYRSDPTRAPALPILKGRHVTLTCRRCTVHVDDELWAPQGSEASVIELSVEAEALRFLVPPRMAPSGA